MNAGCCSCKEKDLVQDRIKTDTTFAEALLCEGIDTLLVGDVETGKTILCDYIEAAVSVEGHVRR